MRPKVNSLLMLIPLTLWSVLPVAAQPIEVVHPTRLSPGGNIEARPAPPPRPPKTFALICVTANDFYFGGLEPIAGEYLEVPEEVTEDELDHWIGQCGNQALALQDRDGFPAQGLLAYYQLRQTGCSDADITFMLWHDDEPGNSMCETPVNDPDDNDGAIVGGGDEWIDYDGDGQNDLDGIDTDGDGLDDLVPVIDFENNDPNAPAQAVTVANFIAALQNIAARAGSQDEVYIYLVGHGVRLPAQPGAPPQPGDPVLFTFESGQATPNNLNDDGITDQQLYSLISTLFGGRHAPQVTVMVDCCYSGRFIRTEQRLTFSNRLSENPRVAVYRDTVHVVYEDDRSNGIYEVYYRRSTDGGLTWSDEVRLSPLDNRDSRRPAIAVNGNTVHVVWDDARDYGSPTLLGEIFYRRSTDGGANWRAEQRLTTADNGQSICPDIGVSGNYVHVVWHDQRDYASPTCKGEIYYKRSSDRGANWGNDTRLTNSAAASERPRIAVVGQWIHLTWWDTRDSVGDPCDQDTFLAEVYYKRGSNNGDAWGADRRISDRLFGCDSANPDIAAAGNNVYIVWWEDLSCYGDPDTELQMRRSFDNGNTFGPADGQQISRWDRNVEDAPAVAVRDPNQVYALWAEGWDVQLPPGPLPPAQLRDIAYHWSHDAGDRLYHVGCDALLTAHYDDSDPNDPNHYVGDTATPDLCMTDSRSHFVWTDMVGNNNREVFFRAVPFRSIWISAAGDVPSLYYMEASSSSHTPDPYAGSFMFYRFWQNVDGGTTLDECYWIATLQEGHNWPGVGPVPTMFIQFPDYYLDYAGRGADLAPGCENLVSWADDFDAYELDSSLHGQGGWKGWDNDPNFTAYVTDAQARSWPHAVDVVDTTDLVHEFDGCTAGKWRFTAWIYIPDDFTSGENTPYEPGTQLLLLNTYNDGGPYKWSVQYVFDSNDGMLEVAYGNGQDMLSTPYVTDRWSRIEVIIDLDNDETRLFYDGEFLVEYSWTGGIHGGGGGASDIAAVDLFANGSTSVYYDDISLKRILDP